MGIENLINVETLPGFDFTKGTRSISHYNRNTTPPRNTTNKRKWTSYFGWVERLLDSSYKNKKTL
jgi:hypothetical protein